MFWDPLHVSRRKSDKQYMLTEGSLDIMIDMPHSSIPSDILWKHIGTSFPEPQRLKHLSLWLLSRSETTPLAFLPLVEELNADTRDQIRSGGTNAAKAKAGKSKVDPRTKVSDRGKEMASEVMKRLLSQVRDGEIEMNTFPPPVSIFAFRASFIGLEDKGSLSQTDSQGARANVVGLRPHPQNVSNKESEAKMAADIRRYV